MTKAFGASFARQASDAHELLRPNGKKDAFKDAYNNEVGVGIGESFGSMNAFELAIEVAMAVARGNTLNYNHSTGQLYRSGTSQ